jgi:hypothetical protein
MLRTFVTDGPGLWFQRRWTSIPPAKDSQRPRTSYRRQTLKAERWEKRGKGPEE